jgi:2-keto-3-deoxy-L-rhamnonate aldolase RhmA
MICTTGPKRRRGPSILASTKLAIGTMEQVGALDTIGEIVSTPGLDLVFIGLPLVHSGTLACHGVAAATRTSGTMGLPEVAAIMA